METSSRRKACDLCFKKKIRCDGLKPTCSNCSLYNVSCKTTTIRRKPGSNYKQTSVATVEANAEENKKDDGIDARLARIEAKLDALRDTHSSISLGQLLEQDSPNESIADISSNLEIPQESSSAGWIRSRSRDEPPVPPLTEALPIVEVYFQNYNSVIPLFDQQSFMRIMSDYYKTYGERQRIYGAVINVVLAMGYRVQFCQYGDVAFGFNDIKIKTCVDNAQIMLDELMTRDEDTLGLQALLGLAILYQTHTEQTPSSVLISAAVRIAHRMRLESRTALSELAPQEARHRANIFWICYMLDKDISLRTITPSLQVDSDIDIDLPGSVCDDGTGIIYSTDGLAQLNLFRVKVQLAHIEGKIYDTLLSNRSRKLSNEARHQAVVQIDRLLERWKKSIPAPLQLENMSGNLLSGPLILMTVLYQTYLMCLTMTHGLYTYDSPWLKALGGLGSDLLRSFHPRSDVCMDPNGVSTPMVWEKCVSASRAILKILSYQSFGGCSVWLSACAYFSAMTFLFVNLIYHPTSILAEHDQELAELAMLKLQKYFDFKGLEKFKQLRHVLVQIENMAKSVLKDAQKSPPETTAQPKYPFNSTYLDIFDISFDQDSANEEMPPAVELDWMGAPGFSTLNADATAAHSWTGASGAEPFWGFGPC
ncbi:hypothetical protein HD806DRAFT_499782 [Xylariaceae sp. AK1471]|nr:hypothetical protein HD806DRAFT_499782 [Xylariaceae sp. AK1471]